MIFILLRFKSFLLGGLDELKIHLYEVHKLTAKTSNLLILLLFSFVLLTGCSTSQNDNLQKEMDKLTSQYEDLQKDYKKLEEDYQLLQTEHENLQLQIEEYQDQQAIIDDLNTKLTELQNQNSALQAEKESLASQVSSLQAAQAQNTTPQADNNVAAPTVAPTPADNGGGAMVWLSETGSKYHSINNCGRMNPNNARQISQASAEASGYGRCSKCF